MMKNITMNLKHLVLTFTLAIFAVAANAATVTYSLKTHVDGRTITSSATVNSVEEIESKMPKEMKRAYTTYTFYWDAEMTQRVREDDELQGTVYVDYEFEPPFIVSDNDGTLVYYFLTCSSTHGGKGWLHCGSTSEDSNVSGDYSEGGTSNPGAGNIYRGEYDFALYGDGYALSIKNRYNGKYLYPETDVRVDDLKQRNNVYYWQFYENSNVVSGNITCSIGSFADLFNSNSTWFITNNWSGFATVERGYSMNNDGKITSEDVAWWFEESINSSQRRGMFRYMIYRYYDVDDIRLRASTPQGTWSSGTQAKQTFMRTSYDSYRDDNYTYKFFKDAAFTVEYGDNDVVVQPENYGVTIVYVLETPKNLPTFVSEPWKTLVLPFDIPNLKEYFGKNGVRVLEYTKVEGELKGDAFSCQLTFEPVSRISKCMPYLFKADRVNQDILNNLRHTVDNMGNPIEIFQYDTNNAPNIRVSMLGVLNEGGYSMEDDGLHFFFGSYPNGDVDDYENYTYKFYRAAATIPQYVCYFFVTDERSGGSAPIRVSFGTESITGVGSVVADIQVNNSIYTLDGRKVNATSLDNLKRGIYIVNGRKVMK